MTSIWEKLNTAKKDEMTEIASEMSKRVIDLEMTHKEAEEIMNILDDVLEYETIQELYLSVSKWRDISISNVTTKEAFEKIVIALTERYSEGEKAAGYDNSVKYIYNTEKKNYAKNIQVTLSVKTTVTGCKLIKEKVFVPEQITPAHEEEKTRVECAPEGLGALFG
jgi:DNA polymerase elongation subunit (family B)